MVGSYVIVGVFLSQTLWGYSTFTYTEHSCRDVYFWFWFLCIDCGHHQPPLFVHVAVLQMQITVPMFTQIVVHDFPMRILENLAAA